MTVAATLGLILAGGASRRMGGRDKAWLRWQAKPLVCHAFQRLAPQVDAVAVSSNRHFWAYRRLGLDCIPDSPAWRGRGPLAAIATALQLRAPMRLAIVPVDAPCAPVDHIARLVAALDRGVSAAAIHDGDQHQPLFALLNGDLASAAVETVSRESPPSMRDWLDAVGTKWVGMSAQPETFANINTPDELRRLRMADRSCARI